MDLFGGIQLATAVPGVTYHSGYIAAGDADRMLQQAIAEIAWEQRPVIVSGVMVQQPRLVCMLGKAGVSYTYAGLTLTTAAMPPWLANLMERVSHTAREPFNCALANFYRDGKDSIGLHRDAEPELGSDPVIASISLGASRTFVMKPVGNAGDRQRIVLTSGSLLVMGRGVQRAWLHGIDKEPGAGPRVNFTFRRIVPR